MPQSNMTQMLINLQRDLNSVTICSIQANGSITDMLSLYGDHITPAEDIPLYVARLAGALSGLCDAFEKFMNDADELSRYLDAKG